MPSKYTPEKRTIGNLLSMTNPPIKVPDWQRNYSWTTSEADVFWSDLVRFNGMYPADNMDDQEYFLGSVVLVDQKDSHLVLDGQQRLATSAILLSAIRDFVRPLKNDAATRISQRFLTDIDDAQNRRIYKITLNRYDREFFKREVLEERDDDYQAPIPNLESHRLIRNNRSFFVGALSDASAHLDTGEERLKFALRIQTVLTNHMSVVAVISQDEDNAANVFETLNDRGIGLSTADLLRNLIMRRARENEVQEIGDLWAEILSIDNDAKMNEFIRHYWISNEGDVKTQSLYREIKSSISAKNIESLTFSRSLKDASGVYRDIALGQHDSNSISRILSGIVELGAKLLYPIALTALQTKTPEEAELITSASVATYVRHSVVGGLENSKLENKIYRLAKELRGSISTEDAISELRDFAPTDEQFENAFARAKVSRRATQRYLLRALEEARRTTEEVEVAPPSRVHVEHVYPQTPAPNDRWPNHDAMIDRLGNLSLLGQRLNAGARNGTIDQKRPFYAQSALLLSNELADSTNWPEWNEDAIDRRQGQMAKEAVAIWKI